MNYDEVLAKRVLTILLIVFFLLFMWYKPYEGDYVLIQGFLMKFFYFFFNALNYLFSLIHEAGHVVCRGIQCGSITTSAMGTIFELGFPLVCGIITKLEGNKFGFCIGLFFLGFNMTSTASYIASSREMGQWVSAEKNFTGQEGTHDFYTILNHFGLLNSDLFIGEVAKYLAIIIMIYALVRMVYLAFVEERL